MITQSEREILLTNMTELLQEYDYGYTLVALNKIIDEWADKKSSLIEAFKRHPNYVEGKFLIAFSTDYEREINLKAVEDFKEWLKHQVIRTTEMVAGLPKDIDDERKENGSIYLPRDLYNFLAYLNEHVNSRTISSELASIIDAIMPQVHAHKGQKTSRVINKMLTYLNYNKHTDYNREFAKFADALSPLQITRHTVLSINPLDYLTMSFGNSWSSCHTIDKENKRDMPNSYEGMYSSGTMSYMLDGSSMVLYTVDSKYDGNDFWTQPKINRQMFHWGEDKLVQSRLYPQDNDGCADVYEPYRKIAQSIMSVIFDFPNYWTIKKGYDAAGRYITSYGTHYRDYDNFDSCTLSTIKGNDNKNSFSVGAKPICINCGNRHHVSDNINCCGNMVVCKKCGSRIYEDDACEMDGEYYCEDCVRYCDFGGHYEYADNVTYIASVGEYVCNECLDEYFFSCPICGACHRNRDAVYADDIGQDICPDCADEYYRYCDCCGELIRREDLHQGSDGDYYCDECYKEYEEEE